MTLAAGKMKTKKMMNPWPPNPMVRRLIYLIISMTPRRKSLSQRERPRPSTRITISKQS